MWLLKVFLPILSFLLHTALLCLWSYGLYMQTAPDTIDPAHQNKGAPWYITKSCNIVDDKINRAYCMQAKSSFAVTIIMMYVFLLKPLQMKRNLTDLDRAIYAAFLILTVYSLIPTAEARQAHSIKRAERKAEKEKWANSPVDNEMTAEEQWQHMWELQQLPRTPGTAGGLKSPMTPRTRTFADLEGQHNGYANTQPEHAGFYGGGAVMQAVSPVAEQDEYIYEGKGKQHAGGSAY
jgi:hypothetical protein